MNDHSKEIKQLAEEFQSCQKVLLALGDENRQLLILEMMKIEDCGGVRVGTITEKLICHVLRCPIIFRF